MSVRAAQSCAHCGRRACAPLARSHGARSPALPHFQVPEAVWRPFSARCALETAEAKVGSALALRLPALPGAKAASRASRELPPLALSPAARAPAGAAFRRPPPLPPVAASGRRRPRGGQAPGGPCWEAPCAGRPPPRPCSRPRRKTPQPHPSPPRPARSRSTWPWRSSWRSTPRTPPARGTATWRPSPPRTCRSCGRTAPSRPSRRARPLRPPPPLASPARPLLNRTDTPLTRRYGCTQQGTGVDELVTHRRGFLEAVQGFLFPQAGVDRPAAPPVAHKLCPLPSRPLWRRGPRRSSQR